MRNNSCNYSPTFINFYSTPDRGAESAVYDCIVVNATDRRGSGGVAIWHAVALPVYCTQTATWRNVDTNAASVVVRSASTAAASYWLRREPTKSRLSFNIEGCQERSIQSVEML